MATSPMRRARHWFWALVIAAVLLTGALSAEISADPSAGTGLSVLLTGTALALVGVQATRVMAAISRATVKDPTDQRRPRPRRTTAGR